MPIDASIYSQIETPDLVGSFMRGYSFGDLIRQKKADTAKAEKERLITKAFESGVVTNPDGTTGFNSEKTLSALAKISPEKFLEARNSFQEYDQKKNEYDVKQKLDRINFTARLLGNVNDQISYSKALQLANENGIDTRKMPVEYDPQLVKNYYMSALSAQEQLENKWKEVNNTWRSKEFGLKERATNQADKRLEIDATKAKAQTQKGAGKMTEAQSKSLGFGRRAMLADQMVNQISKGTDVSSLSTQLKTSLPKWMGDFRSPQEQALATAKLGFVASVLRKESGAAVTPNEFEQYDKLYFPQMGDSQSTLETKKVLRQNFIDTEKLTAGEAWRDPIPFKQNAAQNAKPKTVMQNGFTYTLNPKTGEYE